MKISDWTNEFHHLVKWTLRMKNSVYDDLKSNWISCIERLYEFDNELSEYLVVKKDKLRYKITYEQLFDLTHKYIEQARNNNNSTIGHFFFVLWCNLKCLFKKDKKNFILCNCSKYLRDATQAEIDYANKNLCPNEDKREVYKDVTWYDNTTQILTYRDINAPIDSVWGCAHVLDDNNVVKTFSLDWDWWFPIDEYLDLERGWKHD